MVERDRVERRAAGSAQELVPGHRLAERVVGTAGVRHVDDMLDRRQRGADLRHLVAPVDGLDP